MSKPSKYTFRNILGAVTWILLGCGTIVLLVAAMKQKNNTRCRGIEIKINGVQNNFFIDKNDVAGFIEKTTGKPEGQLISSFDLYRVEALLEKNEWIKNAELFFDNNEKLVINIMEREPVARIFGADGSSYYIDTTARRLSLSDRFSARVPVFTNLPVKTLSRTKSDSLLLRQVKDLGEYILKNPFWMAQVDQVNITPDRTFELVPKVGNQLIIFGTAENYKEKFDNLLIFYRNVVRKVGWNKYSQINVAFRGQVIGVKRGAEDIKMDSLRTIQLMKSLAANAQKMATDSVGNVQLVQPQDDNYVPFAPDVDESLPEESAIVDQKENNHAKENTVTPIKTSPPITLTHVPEKPSLSAGSKSNLPTVVKKVRPPIFKSIERPNPYHRPAVKIVTKKPAEKIKEKPKAVMPAKVTVPKNDY